MLAITVPVIPCAIAVIAVGGFLIYRRVDVRLILLLCAAVLFCVAATQPAMAGRRGSTLARFFVEVASAMANPQYVVPICSAMGFAYVCKQTGCDAHLVEMLCRPLREVRWLLVPGGVAVGFFVNSAIVSQTSTISVVGPVLVPLVIAAGFSRRTAGAILLLGGSMGGELMNPAAVEVTATHKTINGLVGSAGGVDALGVIRYLTPYNLAACAVAMCALWLLTLTRDRKALETEIADGGRAPVHAGGPTAQEAMIHSALSTGTTQAVDRIDYARAFVPLVPIFLLVVVRRFVPLPDVLRPSDTNKIAEQATIAAAMIIGVAVAAIVAPGHAGGVAASFFEGAGFAYAHVISVIVAATVFARGIEINGLIDWVTRGIGQSHGLVTVASVAIPWIMASVTGTAVGSAPPIITLLVPVAMGPAPTVAQLPAGLHIGTLCAIAAQFGRTTSPVAPVVLMSAAISRTHPSQLLRFVLPSLLAGGAVLLLLGLLLR